MQKENRIELLTIVYILCAAALTLIMFLLTNNGISHQMLFCYLAIFVIALIGVGIYRLAIGAGLEMRIRMKQSTIITLFTSVLVALSILFIMYLGTDINLGMLKGLSNEIGFYSIISNGMLSLFVFYSLILIIMSLVLHSLFREGTFVPRNCCPTFSKQSENIPFLSALSFACIFVFCYCYRPNIFGLGWYSRHHITAVTQSIFNVAFDEPYTTSSSSIYGHYAIFFWPFLKLLGHSPKVVMLLISIIGVLMECFWGACLCEVTQKNSLRVIGVLSPLLSLTYSGTYLQTMPIRWLFPFAVLLFMLKKERKGELLRLNNICRVFFLCALGMVWQTDSGITICLSAVLCLWCSKWKKEKPLSKQIIAFYFKTVLGAVVAFLLMGVIVNGYNIFCGGGVITSALLFPLVSGEGYTQFLTSSSIGGEFWICLLPMLLFCLLIMFGLSSTTMLKCKAEDETFKWTYIGIVGLSQCYYFLNRMIAGPGNVVPYAVLGMIAIIDLFFQHRKNKASLGTISRSTLTGVTYAALFILSGMTAVSVSKFGDVFEQSYWNYNSLVDVSWQVRDVVPKDTYAIGYGTQEVYAELGWDPQYHLRDQSDLFGIAYDTAKEELNQQSAVLFSSGMGELLEGEDWEFVAALGNSNITMDYYVKRGIK